MRTLVQHFESEGFPYNEQTKFEKGITYRNIEKLLVQNNIDVSLSVFFLKKLLKKNLSYEQIEMILKELQKKLEVDPITKIEKKKKKYINLLHWISMK